MKRLLHLLPPLCLAVLLLTTSALARTWGRNPSSPSGR